MIIDNASAKIWSHLIAQLPERTINLALTSFQAQLAFTF